MRVEEFNYSLPESSIAQVAVEPRDSARLLDTRDLSDHRFTDLPQLLEEGDLVVVNDTRVRAARVKGSRRDTGGAIELLLLGPGEDGAWQALAKPSRRLRPGVVIELEGVTAEVVDGPDEGVVTVELSATDDLEAAIDRAGEIPLPPYFQGVLPEPGRYQTMFARSPGSSAAPTAGLHFTPRVVDGLQARGIAIATVDLHVGLDTFRPMSVEQVEDHRIHREWCSIPPGTARAVAETRIHGGRIVAIGTTVVRTLESLANDDGTVETGQTETGLFLRPGSSFRVVDLLVTNFHVPASTLVVLVAAFMGPAWRKTYRTALDRGYRFLSFGDAMLASRSEGTTG
jgi:S-adenosylmethionine:tRNA ribosyltransferase-isomerase